jgi:hypothetical protein
LVREGGKTLSWHFSKAWAVQNFCSWALFISGLDAINANKEREREVKRIIKMLTQKRITFFSSRTASWHGKGWEAQTRMKSL